MCSESSADVHIQVAVIPIQGYLSPETNHLSTIAEGAVTTGQVSDSAMSLVRLLQKAASVTVLAQFARFDVSVEKIQQHAIPHGK